MVVREGLTKEAMFGQRWEREGVRHEDIWAKSIEAERMASVKTLGWNNLAHRKASMAGATWKEGEELREDMVGGAKLPMV